MFRLLFKAMSREAGMETAKKGWTDPAAEMINAVGNEDTDEILAIMACPVPPELNPPAE